MGVSVDAEVEVAGIVGTALGTVGVFSEGLKGVSEGEAFGLGVTVGPMMVGEDRPEPVHAVRIKKKKERSKNVKRRSMFIFFSTPNHGGVGKEKPTGKSQ